MFLNCRKLLAERSPSVVALAQGFLPQSFPYSSVGIEGCVWNTGQAPFMTHQTNIQKVLIAVVRALVDDEENIDVKAVPDGDGTVLLLYVAQRDVGKIIGKQGRTARALRTILAGVSMNLGHRYSLDIIESKLTVP